MPKPDPLKGQSGSALAGVVGLSTVLAVAASGYMLLTANTGRTIEYGAVDRDLHYAAESGIQMAAGWVRAHATADFDDGDCTDFQLNPDGSLVVNGYTVRVSIVGVTGSGFRTLTSVASKEPGEPEETITWRVAFPPPGESGNPTKPKLNLSEYQETFKAQAD